MFPISLDLENDLVEILFARLAVLNIPVVDAGDPDRVFTEYLSIMHRGVDCVPYKVVRAAEFHCPTEYSAIVDEIERKAQRGDDLNPHLSRSASDPHKRDPLLNDWGIKHLHLHTVYGDPKLIARSGPLLFIRIHEGTMQFLTVAKHGAWSKRELIDLVHENWPDTLEAFRAPGVSPFAPTEAEKASLRRKNANSTYTSPSGKVYFPPGGGSMASGLNMQIRISVDQMRNHLQLIDADVRQRAQTLIRGVADKTNLDRPLRFRLRLDEDGVVTVAAPGISTVLSYGKLAG